MGPTSPGPPQSPSVAPIDAGAATDAAPADTSVDADHVRISDTISAPPTPGPRYLKGSTHVHTAAGSGDSNTPLSDVIRWYTQAGYDFIIVTDHNKVTLTPSPPGLLVMSGVELTHNPASCEPPPPEPDGKCRIHVNALFVTAAAETARAAAVGRAVGDRIVWKETRSRRRVDMYQRAIDETRALGGVAQLNHPVWHWGVDGALLTALGRRGIALVEIANDAFARWNPGTATYPGAEAIWDAALTAGVRVWGVASDDAHHYYDVQARRDEGKTVYPPGGGFVMVRAEQRPDAIRAALLSGAFYSSSGVILSRVGRGAGRDIVVEVADASAGEHEIAFVGNGGAVLARSRGRRATLSVPLPYRGYVRAVIRGPSGARAWTQPVWFSAP